MQQRICVTSLREEKEASNEKILHLVGMMDRNLTFYS